MPTDISELKSPPKCPASDTLESLQLLPNIAWDKGFYKAWDPTLKGARINLDLFLKEKSVEYNTARDIPSVEGTSRLSPYLHFGQISPRQIWEASMDAGINAHKSGWRFLTEVGWREFAYHLLYHFPETTTKPLRQEFEHFPWQEDDRLLKAWQTGQTGVPIVDAGMRELWATGWMHNRVRMIAGSYLVKHLLQPWQRGAEWFWDTLVDADLASNTLGWQWVGGCGADAAPYFRVFNPVLQAAKFDTDGDYIRKWVPEIARLSDVSIRAPWEVNKDELSAAGITLGKDYPMPAVELGVGRQRALQAYEKLKYFRNNDAA